MSVHAVALPTVGNAAAISHRPAGPVALPGVGPARLTDGAKQPAVTPANPTWHSPSPGTGTVVLGRGIQVAGAASVAAGVGLLATMVAKHQFFGGGVGGMLGSFALGAGLLYEGQRTAKGDPGIASIGAMSGNIVPIALGATGVILGATAIAHFRSATGLFEHADALVGGLAGVALLADVAISSSFPGKYKASGTAGTLVDGSERPLAARGSDDTNRPARVAQADMPSAPAVTKAVDSTVRIFNDHYGPGIASVGSGWTAQPDTIVTNAHVVSNSSKLTVRTHDGRELPGTVVQFDPAADLAVVHVDGLHLAPLPLDDVVEDGETAASIGYPNDHFAVKGATARELIDIANPAGTRHVLELDGDIDHGNSGGPIVNAAGEVIGTVFSGEPHVFVLGLTNDMVRGQLAAASGKTAAVDTRVGYGPGAA